MTRIAVDLDTTTALTMEPVLARLHEQTDVSGGPYGYPDMETWEWVTQTYSHTEFSDAFQYVWENTPEEIEPAHEDLNTIFNYLDSLGEVDIVTDTGLGTPLTVSNKLDWVLDNYVVYNQFRQLTGPERAQAGYDYYIDDQPDLPARCEIHNEEATVLLQDQKYNRPDKLPGEEYIRCDGLPDAVDTIWREQLTASPPIHFAIDTKN